MSQHDDTTRIETLLDESGDRKDPGATKDPGTTEATGTTGPDGGTSTTPTSPTAPWSPYEVHRSTPEFKSGPAPTTSVVGLLGLLTVIAVLVAQATDLDIPWGVVGPVAVVGAGVLLVVLGLAGLRGQRYRG